MGYSVYYSPGNARWQGYGVPAECDMRGCHEMIDLGLGYRCDTHYVEDDWGVEKEEEGCELFFCSKHLYDSVAHGELLPKPNGDAWNLFLLLHESWSTWRAENLEKASRMRRVFFFHPVRLVRAYRTIKEDLK